MPVPARPGQALQRFTNNLELPRGRAGRPSKRDPAIRSIRIERGNMGHVLRNDVGWDDHFHFLVKVQLHIIFRASHTPAMQSIQDRIPIMIERGNDRARVSI